MTSRGAEKMNNDTIGVDVSKDHLDAHRLADGAARRFANDRRGHKALIKWLAQTPRYRVVFEPTGPYHRAIERALGVAGVPFVKVNPRQARRFAEATGKLAKTDRLDAAILARMGALLELQARPARSEILLELKELYVAREALVKDRTAARNRGKVLTLVCASPGGRRRRALAGPQTHSPLRKTGVRPPSASTPSMSILSEPIIQSMWIMLLLPPRAAISSAVSLAPSTKHFA